MNHAVCNSTSHELNPEPELQSQISRTLLIEPRVASDYEACHWIVQVEKEKYRDDTGAYIELYFTNL